MAKKVHLYNPVNVASISATIDGVKSTTYLQAERDDLAVGNYDGDAEILNGEGERLGIAPLQSHYKFGFWPDPEWQPGDPLPPAKPIPEGMPKSAEPPSWFDDYKPE